MSIWTILEDKHHEVKKGRLSRETVAALERSSSRRDAEGISAAIFVAYEEGKKAGYPEGYKKGAEELRECLKKSKPGK